jgi:predicted metal-binding protein
MTNISSNLKNLCKFAVENGAVDAKEIKPASVVVEHWVLLKCKFGCGSYDSTRACPPHLPSPEEFKIVLSEYKSALMVKFVAPSGKAGFKLSHDVMPKLEREAFLMGYYKAFASAAGPCQFCEECTPQDCKNFKLSRPSLEGFGVDVYATARKAGFDIEVRKDKTEMGTYYGLLLVE